MQVITALSICSHFDNYLAMTIEEIKQLIFKDEHRQLEISTTQVRPKYDTSTVQVQTLIKSMSEDYMTTKEMIEAWKPATAAKTNVSPKRPTAA